MAGLLCATDRIRDMDHGQEHTLHFYRFIGPYDWHDHRKSGSFRSHANNTEIETE